MICTEEDDEKMKMFKKLMKKDVGAIGIGAMIIFIAMVLVAGIAASVLVQTANRLETQAMETGAETTDEVSTGLRVVDIEGYKCLREVCWRLVSTPGRTRYRRNLGYAV